MAALDEGTEVEIVPITRSRSLWHCLRALSVGSRAAEFEVTLLEAEGSEVRQDAEDGSGRQGGFRILARRGGAWEDFSWDTSEGFFVSGSTQTAGLARKAALELRKGSPATLHTFADAENAIWALMKALATVPRLEGGAPLKCTVGGRAAEGEGSPRVVVHASMPPPKLQPASGDEFLAWTPSTGSDEKARRRFANSVRQRLEMGWSVAMVCRGAESALHAMDALASVRGRTAEFEVRWADGIQRPGSAAVPRELRVRATSGASWGEFNATDFSRTRLLRAKADANVKLLAQNIGSEVKRLGAVAVHSYVVPEAVSRAVKALASVPVENNGLRVRAVPSFGWATAADHSGERRRSLRLYVRRAGAAPAAAGGGGDGGGSGAAAAGAADGSSAADDAAARGVDDATSPGGER